MASPNRSRRINHSRRRRFNPLQHPTQDRLTSATISHRSYSLQRRGEHREGASIMSGSQPSFSRQPHEDPRESASIVSDPQPSFSRQLREERRNGASNSGSRPPHSRHRHQERRNGANVSTSQPSYSRQRREVSRDHAIMSSTQPPRHRQLNGSSVSCSNSSHTCQRCEGLVYGASSQSRHLNQQPPPLSGGHIDTDISFGAQPANLPQELPRSYVLSGSQAVNDHQEQRNAYDMSRSQATNQRQQHQELLRDRNMSRRQALNPIQPSVDQANGHNPSGFHPVNPSQLRGQVDGRNLPGSQSANHNGRHLEEPRENNSFASHPSGPGQLHEEPEPTGTEGPNLLEGVPFEHMPAAVRHLEASLRNGTYNDIGDGPLQYEDIINQTTSSQDDDRQSSEVEESSSSGSQRSNSNQQGQGRRQHRSRGDRSATTPSADPRPMGIEEAQLVEEISRQALRNMTLLVRRLQASLRNATVDVRDFLIPQGQGVDEERDTTLLPDHNGNLAEGQDEDGSGYSVVTDSDMDRVLGDSAFSSAVDVFTDCFEFCDLSAHSNSYNQDCSICLVELKAGQIVRRLRCKHVFHRDCVDQWFVDSRSCPLCRLDVEGPPLL